MEEEAKTEPRRVGSGPARRRRGREGSGGHRWRLYVWAVVLVAALAGLWILAGIPMAERRGVNYVISVGHVPLYLKVLDFVDRDVHYGRLARSITSGGKNEEERILAVFQWTRASIRDVPDTLPVLDDHIWNTIVRGYGTAEQKSDVFTTLVAYLGIPAYRLRLQADSRSLPISLVKLGRSWRVLDVDNNFVFRDRSGDLATVEEIASDPLLVAIPAGERNFRGVPYMDYFKGFHVPVPPRFLPPYGQMLGPRLLFEARRLLGR